MSLLYLITTTVEYKGMSQKQLFKTWTKEAEELLKAKEQGKVLQIWKVSEIMISNLQSVFIFICHMHKKGYSSALNMHELKLN